MAVKEEPARSCPQIVRCCAGTEGGVEPLLDEAARIGDRPWLLPLLAAAHQVGQVIPERREAAGLEYYQRPAGGDPLV